jgi:hypothetical protein
MNNHCWYTVKIKTENAFNPSFVIPSATEKPLEVWVYPASTVFSSEWLEYTKSLGMNFTVAKIFYRQVGCNADKAHIDTLQLNQPTFALNWLFSGGKGSKMVWYEVPPGEHVLTRSPSGIPFFGWPISTLTPIEEYEIGDKVTLVKTGIPHSIFSGPTERWCASAREDDDSTWDSMVQRLKERNLLVPRYI